MLSVVVDPAVIQMIGQDARCYFNFLISVKTCFVF